MSEPYFEGVVWTDAASYAEVTLPHYAPAVAARFRYELTPMRPRVHAVVAAQLAGNRFTIHTDEPHIKVAWRLVPLPSDEPVPTRSRTHHLHEGGTLMSIGLMKRTALLFALFGAALTITASAAAFEPTRETVTFTTVAPRPCPSGVALIGIFNATHDITTFYDNDGAPVRELTMITFEVTTTNPLTGQSLPGSGMRIFHRDLVTGEFFTTGNNVVTKLPEGGVAIGGAGRLVFDAQGRLIGHNGPDSESEREQLCAALGA
jgi:hypothetical protein